MLYKQYIRTAITYASPSWAPITSHSNIEKLQRIQNKAFRVATGCLRATAIPHLHCETKILPLRDHLDMRGTQFCAPTLNEDHTCHSLHNRPPHSRHKKRDPITHYSSILQSIGPLSPTPPTNADIHTSLTSLALSHEYTNPVLNGPPPEICADETSLPRGARTTLSQLRCGKHPSLHT